MTSKKPVQEMKATPAPEGYIYVIEDRLEDVDASFLTPGVHLRPLVAESHDAFEYVSGEGETGSITKELAALTREGALDVLRSHLQDKKETLEQQKQLLDAALSGDCLVFFFDADGEQEDDPVAL